jgi:hypothetical protein
MQDSSVPQSHSIANPAGIASLYMHYAAILYIGLAPKRNGCKITAKHSAEPDAGTLANRDVA